MKSMSYILAAVTSRTSIFYNLILAVIRTINIVQPFYLIRKKYVIISAVLYPLLWVGISIADIVITLRVDGWSRVYESFFVPLPGACVIDKNCSVDSTVTPIVLLGIPFTVPVIIMIICAAIQSYCLLKQTVNPNPNIVSNNRKITVTILLITLVCIVCNIAYLVFWFSFVFNTDLISGLSYVRWHSMMYTASTTLPFLNASINPLILITRGSELREYVINCVLYPVRRITAVYRTCISRMVNNNNVLELNELIT